MTDEKLARGLGKRFLNELGTRLPAATEDLDELIERAPRNIKGMKRRIARLERRHRPLIGPILCKREAGTTRTIVPCWRISGLAVVGGDYEESGSLISSAAIVEVDRTGVGVRHVDGPVVIHRHALRRLIERDLTLPPYSFESWLAHLNPALTIAIGLAKLAEPDRNQQPIALPTRGGLFIAFLLRVERGWCASCHSFVGQHELGEPEQHLHADLLAACPDDFDMAMALHDAHGPLWTGERPMLLRATNQKAH
jgi:hypothetical protein